MKRLICLVSLIFCFAIGFSQQKGHSNNIISVSAGVSLPAAAFASTNASNIASGYARQGGAVNVSFEHKINSRFGFVAVLYGSQNALNNGTLTQQLNQTQFQLPGNGMSPLPQYALYTNWGVEKQNWQVLSALVGVAYELPFTPKSRLAFTAGAAMGLARVAIPAQNATAVDDTVAIYIKQGGATTLAAAYLLSAGLKYRLAKRLALVAGIDYFGTIDATFANLLQKVTTLQNFKTPNDYTPQNAVDLDISSNQTGRRQPLGLFNAHAGVALSL